MKIWLIGSYGIVATTAMVGAKAIEKEIIDTTGVVSTLEDFKAIDDLIPLKFEFGGHDIRALKHNAYEVALAHWEINKHFDFKILQEVKNELELIKAKKGTALNCGPGIKALGEIEALEDENLTLKEIVEKIEKDILEFKGNDEDIVVINVASTEPVYEYHSEYHDSLEGFEKMIEENKKEYVTASMIYAYVALKNGIPYANFTPSAGASIKALKELAEKVGVPHAGNDGKTGETMVKTNLAPMFAYRNLKVLGWMSYNILGDLDGVVLNHNENKKSKIISKDSVLQKALGYSPYSITEINYFPSLQDNKTAFNFIHYQGFMGTKLKLYFIWDAIDAIVAAPLLIDLARFLIFAKKKSLKGVIQELGFFFKSPLDTNIVNLHQQFEILKDWFNKNLK